MARRLSRMAARVAEDEGGVIVKEKHLWWPDNFARCYTILDREGEPTPAEGEYYDPTGEPADDIPF